MRRRENAVKRRLRSDNELQVSKIRSIRKYDREFDDLESRLRAAVGVLRQTCEKLLTGISIPDDQFRDLINNQKGWDSEKLKLKLRDRMGEMDNQDFERAACGLRNQMTSLREQLRLTEDWRVS